MPQFSSLSSNATGTLLGVADGAVFRRIDDRWQSVEVDPQIGPVTQVLADLGGRLMVLGADGQVWQRLPVEGVGAGHFHWHRLDADAPS